MITLSLLPWHENHSHVIWSHFNFAFSVRRVCLACDIVYGSRSQSGESGSRGELASRSSTFCGAHLVHTCCAVAILHDASLGLFNDEGHYPVIRGMHTLVLLLCYRSLVMHFQGINTLLRSVELSAESQRVPAVNL